MDGRVPELREPGKTARVIDMDMAQKNRVHPPRASEGRPLAHLQPFAKVEEQAPAAGLQQEDRRRFAPRHLSPTYRGPVIPPFLTGSVC